MSSGQSVPWAKGDGGKLVRPERFELPTYSYRKQSRLKAIS
jgi:hypothetical protein